MAKGNDQTDFFSELGIPTGLSDELLNELKKYLSSQNKNGFSNDLWTKLIAEVDELTQSYIHVFIYKGTHKKNEYIQYNAAVLKNIMKYKNSNDDLLFNDLLKTVNLEQLIETLRLNCSDKLTDSCFKFVHNQLIPMVFSNSTPKKTLEPLIDLLLLMPAGFAFDHMTEYSTRKFKNDILVSYIPNIDPVNPKSMNWWRLCKVLIHYCGRILHNEIELTNAILRVVEVGFKTKTVEDRCGSYECWKALTDNYNLDKKYLKNSKQIRLLIKPLKAKLSRNCQVSVKRFEAYANLIEKLENFSVPCIEDFLVFCFGPLSEDFDVAGNEHLLNPGRSVIEVFPRSTEILLKLLGHNMNVDSCCLNKNTFLTDIYKVKPFLDSNILSNYATVFISCVRICSELTLQWTKDNNRDIVINCLWSSFFRLLIDVPDNGKREILQTIHRNIQAIIKKCDCDKSYYSILKVILRAVLYYLDEIPNSELIQSVLVSPIVYDICALETKVPELTNSIFNDFLRDFLNYSTLHSKFQTEIENLFKNPQELSPSILMFYLDYTSNLSTEDNNYLISTNRIIDFLMFLITSNSAQCIQYWKIATESFAFGALNLELCLLKKLGILLQSSPQHSSAVLEISWFLPKFSRKYGEEFYNNVLNLICKCLSLPTLKVNKPQVLENFKNVEEIRNKQNYKASENYFKCLEYLLKPHQVFEVLLVLKKVIASMDKSQKDEVPKGLRDILLDLATHSDEEISGNALTLLTRLETDLKSSMMESKLNVPMSRSGRITSMVLKESTASPIRLLGQEVESPHKIRGSLLNLTAKVLSPKPANQMPVFSKKLNNLNDLSDKDFVVIDKEVKLEPEKLSVHQKEMLKRRRDNIPALYQDLTISQSLDSQVNGEVKEDNKSNDNETIVDPKERKVLEKLPSEDENKNMEEKSSDNIDMNKRAVQRALSSLKLDIVGAESYHQNLPKKRQIKRKSWTLPSFAAAEQEEEPENDSKVKAKAETSSENVIPGTRKKRTKPEIVPDKKNKEKKASPGRKKKLKSSSNSEDEEKAKNPPAKRGRKKSIKIIKTDEPKNENLENSPKTINAVQDNISDMSTENINLPNDTKNECVSSIISIPSQDSNPVVTPSTEEVEQKNVIEGNQTSELIIIENNDIKEQNNLDLFVLNSPTSSKKKSLSPRNKVVENTESQESEDLIIPSSQPPLKKCFNNVRVSLFRYNFKDLSPEKLSEQQKLCNMSTETFDNSNNSIPDTETLDPDYEQLGNKTSEMDTLSMDITGDISSLELAVEETPKKKDKEELACSPVTKETPNKNSALMKETCDISPIKVVEVQSVRINQEEDSSVVPDNSWTKESKTSDEAAVLKAPSSRSAKLLNLLPQPVPMKLHKPLLETGPKNIINISSPKTDRIRKMMMNCEEQTKIDFIVLDDDNAIKLNGKDVLKFDREVPSPLATPKISILKRKFPDTIDEGLSPCAKRKRVNFSDPPITCEKIYFKEQEEKSFFKKGRRKSIIKSMSPKHDSIKSIQHQIDSLGTEGVSPLPESPPKNSDEDFNGDADIDIDGVEIPDEVMNAMTKFMNVSVKEKEVRKIDDVCEEVDTKNPEFRMAEEFVRTIERTLDSKNFHKLLIKQIETHIDKFSPEERKRLEVAIIPKS